MNGCIIPENEEKCISPQQENAVFLVMGDEAYTDEMIDEYNRNAEAKTEEFNTNATNKLNAFNENATTKTNAFNTNATTQTDTYNSNAATKLSEYNDNATAKEQSYNSNADTKTQAFNQNAAQKTYEFNQNALAYQEGIEKNAEEIDEVSNRVYRIENNLYDSGTAEGYFINIEDSSYSEFQNVSVDGVCEQETTTGSNLLNLDVTPVNSIANGMTMSFDKDKQILTLDGTIPTEQTSNYQFTFNEPLVIEPGNYTFLAKHLGGNGTVENPGRIRAIRLMSSAGDNIDISSPDGSLDISSQDYQVTEQKTIEKIQIIIYPTISLNNYQLGLYFGKQNTEYEPYTGGQPSPSPDYPQEIEVIEEDFNITSCGKNLFDYNKFLDDIGDSLTIEGTNNNFTYTSNSSIPSVSGTFKFNFKEKTSYSFSGRISSSSANGAMKVIYTDETSFYIYNKWDGTSLSQEFFKTTDGTKTIKQIELSSYGTNTVFELSDFMISQDLTEQPYEPYQGTTTTITLPEGQFAAKISDTIKDQFRIAYNESDGNYHLYLDKNISKDVFKGDADENWIMVASQNNDFYATACFSISKNDVKYNGSAISNYFNYAYLWDNDVEGIWIGESNDIYIRINKEIASTVENFKTWLQSHNTTVYYQLAALQTIDIGKVQMLLTYYPATNVFTDCPLLPTIEVAYYRDFKTTIETMQEDIASNTSRIETLEEQLQSQAITISNLENRITALEPTQTESEVVEQ